MHARAAGLIDALQLQPHPEGGYYRRVLAAPQTLEANGRSRPAFTEIRYLLVAGMASRWHRVDADESWHWLEGGRLQVSTFDQDSQVLEHAVLGSPLGGHAAERVVPAGAWQSARPLGEYALVACRVTPGFVWEGFELLDEDSEPARELERLGVLHMANEVQS